MQDQVRTVLVVDDDPGIRVRAVRALRAVFPQAEFAEAGDVAAGRRALAQGRPDLLLLDHYLPDGVGLDLLQWLQEQQADLPVIYLTSVKTAQVAVAALKSGARDYVIKSRDWPSTLTRAAEGAVAQYRLRRAEQAALERLRESAYRDPLTGLWNRRVLEDAQVEATWGGGALAVAMIDLDGFKAVNDTLGHAAGDRTLQAVAEVLRGSMRDTDLLVRYGGDEFVAVLPRLDEADVENWAQRVRQQLAAGARAGHLPAALDASIGVAVGGGGLRELIQQADAAMYQRKRWKRE